MRRLTFALAAQTVVAASGFGADPTPPAITRVVHYQPTYTPCPPVACPTPKPGGPNAPGGPGTVPGAPGSTLVTPNTPGSTPGVPGTPSPLPDVTTPTPSADNAFARQGEGGTQAARSYAPSMFGDVLGARSIRVAYQASFFCRFGIDQGTVATASGTGVTLSPNAQGARFDFTTGANVRTVNAPFTGTDLRFVQTLTPAGDPDTAFTTAAVQALLSSGGLTPSQVAAFSQLTPNQRAQLVRNRGAINPAVTQATRGLAVQTLTVSNLTAQVNGNFADCLGTLTGSQNVALPGGSTYIGRVKMSEDTSPLPRDRFIFSYDHFDSVPLTPAGLDVNRFQLGVEKTFLDGRWSVEFRLPFAGTLASTNVQGFETKDVELGNVRFALKRILSQNDVLTTTSGIAVTLPTAADQVVLSSLDGSQLYRYRNQQVTVEPFVAALLTPNSRLFSQTWASLNFDTSGGDLTYNTAVFGGSGKARLYDTPFLSVDHQVGYWLIQRDYGAVRGLAPFVELHWNYAIAQQQLLNEVNKRLPGNGLSVGGVAEHELNLIAGVLMQMGDNLNLSVGASAPLLNRPNRTFDAQVGVRASYLFGRTARGRNPIYSVNTF